ncbi:hypothetical protein [Piscinibacter sp. XHJ-5]|uniref:hypothetical protein n=1 Tax=Piscinibacter sp. XHJ-5 TaxID=3037797 RepID=UPI00245372EF|nr:hypothetical protein [Piscinibacter sp. XHJ-5]
MNRSIACIPARNNHGSGRRLLGILSVVVAMVAACSAGADRPPVIVAPLHAVALTGQITSVTIRASDPEGAPVSFEAENLPAFARITDHGDGTATLELNPHESHAGTYPITLVAADIDDEPHATRHELTLRVRSSQLVGSCAQSDADLRAATQPLSSCRAPNGDVEIGPGLACESAHVDRDFTGADALGRVTVKAAGVLYLLDETRSVDLASLTVSGLVQAGSESCPIGTDDPDHTLTLRFVGEGPTTPPPSLGAHTCEAADKGIVVTAGGQLLMHGARGVASAPDGVSWTHLAKPAGPPAYQATDKGIGAPVDAGGEARIFLARDVSKGSNPWKAGDWITIATSSFSPFETEFVQIASVAPAVQGSVVTLRQPLRHYHFGSQDPGVPGPDGFGADSTRNFGVDERAEVGLVSRNIRLTAQTPDPAIAAHDTRLHWGGDMRLCAGFDAVRVRGVEFEKFGKERLGAYPIHFHMAGDVRNEPVIESNSIHHSYNKCVAVHATSNLTISYNVCARAVGHLFYQEMGNEIDTAYVGNLGLGAMSHHFGIADSVARTTDGSPRNFWEGDNLARENGYSAFNVVNTDSQGNPTHSACFVRSGIGDGRVDLVGPAPCATDHFYIEPASGFWITHPSAKLQGNSIGGCQGVGKGYWYVPPPDGSTGARKFDPSGRFVNNRVHACYDGLFSEGHFGTVSDQLFPTVGGLSTAEPTSVNVIGRFSGLTATRNRNRGVWMRPMWSVVENGRFATNRDSVTLVSSGGNDGNAPGVWALLKDSVVVGVSANNVDRWGPCPSTSLGDGPGCVDLQPLANEIMEKGYQTPRWNSAGYMIYDGPVRIVDTRFVNFLRDPSPLLTKDDRDHLAAYVAYPHPGTTGYEGDAALGWFQNNQSAYPTATTVKGLRFHNVDLRHQIYTSKVNLGDFRDGDQNTALIDLDGSLTGFKVVDASGNPVPGSFPISLNNLPFNASSNSVDECLSAGQQDQQFEGRATSLISPGNMATLEFEALWPGGPAGQNWQDLSFFKDSLDYGKHQSMTLFGRNGQGIWEPKVTSGFGYSVLKAFPSSVPGVVAGPAGIPSIVRVGFTDAVKPDMASRPFYVRIGICYTDAGGATPTGSFTIRRGYKSWGGNGVSFNNPLLQPFYNQLQNRFNGEFCHNLDHQNPTQNFGATGCPAHGVTPAPADGSCPPPSTLDAATRQCIYPVSTLTAASSLSEVTNADGTPASFTKYWYDRDIGMLYFYVMQDADNARGVAPIGSCPGDPACPGADELDTYHSCPPQGCINYSVELSGAYTPGEPRCDEKAGGSVYTYQNRLYELPAPAQQNVLAYVVKPNAAGSFNVQDGEIVKRTEVATNDKGFSHSLPAKPPVCPVVSGP